MFCLVSLLHTGYKIFEFTSLIYILTPPTCKLLCERCFFLSKMAGQEEDEEGK